MDSNHTKGPWFAKNVFGLARAGSMPYVEIGEACYSSNRGGDVEEIEANTMLIAAAPEMLEALENALGWHKGDKWRTGNCIERGEWLAYKSRLEGVIARAKGDTA